MDPVSAIGLAAGALAFGQAAFSLAGRFKDLRRPDQNDQSKAVGLVRTAQANLRMMKMMIDSTSTTTADIEILRLHETAETLVDDLFKILDQTTTSSQDTRVKSLKKAFVGTIKQKEIAALESKMARLQEQINSYHLIKMGNESSQTRNEIEQMRDEITQLIKSNKKIEEAVSQPLRQIGYPECGQTSELLFIDDGMSKGFHLPWFLCSSPEKFHQFLKWHYQEESLPGRQQIERGHMEVWNWAETRKIRHEEWPRLANGGKIKLAFIMGHHFGHPDDRCMRCYKPIFMMKSVETHTIFRTCTSCKLSLRRVVCEYDYEPVDGVIAGGPSAFRDYQHKTPRASSKIPMETTGSNPGLAASQNKTTAAEEPSIDLVCRRLTMQWSPIAEYVFRYYLCRCIIWRPLPLLSQDLPHGGEEQTFLRAGDCPRHSTKGKKYAGFDYGDIDYERDRYFEGFGGVKTFRGFTALLLLHKNRHIYEKLGGKSYAGEEEFQLALRMIDSFDEKDDLFLEWGSKYLSGKDDGTRFTKSRISDEELEVFMGLRPDDQGGHQQRERNPEVVKAWNETPMIREVNEILDGRGPTQPNWVIGAT